jgi:hypothetical protein
LAAIGARPVVVSSSSNVGVLQGTFGGPARSSGPAVLILARRDSRRQSTHTGAAYHARITSFRCPRNGAPQHRRDGSWTCDNDARASGERSTLTVAPADYRRRWLPSHTTEGARFRRATHPRRNHS